MTVNILVDTLHLLSPKTGIGKYTYENCIQLQKIASGNIRWHYNYGYLSDKLIEVDSTDNKYNATRKLKSLLSKQPLVKRSARLIMNIGHQFSRKRYDLYWQPNFIPSKGVRAQKTVTSVHDFSFLVHPDWHPAERQKYMTKMVFDGIKRSDWLITGSHFTKGEIVRYAGYDPDKICVIYHGVDHKMFKIYPKEELETFRRRFNLPSQYLLFVGSIEPRKNLLNLLYAYKAYIDSNQEGLPLILVGFQGWQNNEIMSMVRSLDDKVQYLGYLTDQELAYTYNLATLFIYPSLYEGFGIPPLEAMACGTPVITSSTTSIPEVCGEAVLYVDPHDPSDIQKKIESLIEQADLRQTLIQKGLERTKKFSWEHSAQKHLDLFEMVMNI